MERIVKPERVSQNRVIDLFKNVLQYEYLGNWEDEIDNSHIEEALLMAFLKLKYSDELSNKAIQALKKEAHVSNNGDLYNINKNTYSLLRYGVSIKNDKHNFEHVDFIDWKNPLNNHFGVAEEVTIKNAKERRPDIVIYINGIAVGVLELKKASVSVSEGIRQNISNQSHLFNKPFFTTMQLVLAGNDSTGLVYGTTLTSEKYFLTWEEDNSAYNPDELRLDAHIRQFCEKTRLLEIIHDFVIFDKGTKKLCRPNQYFGVKAAQKYVSRNEGGIIWHSQGSGKSLTMVWLAKWLLENKPKARVLIVTDRTELDDQIKGVFEGVGEEISQSKSGADLMNLLNHTAPRLICSLVHKFGGKADDAAKDFIQQLKYAKDFDPKGEFIVFIDECHRTQSGDLHEAMKAILPDSSIFIGFTGTPLIKKDKKKSLEVFGSYIHSYKFDKAVKDGVVLDLRYEARDVDQQVADQKGIDEWFDLNTQGMNELPKAELKQQWGTMQKLLSSKGRLEKIVFDIKMDFIKKPRLKHGRGNAMLVVTSIYEACRYYELFTSHGFKKCAIITSYTPNESSVKIEDTGDGDTAKKEQLETYQKMLKDYNQTNAAEFEAFAKKKFKDEPANMQLLIVVDKLLTGFDAVHCTYLYIDKQMQDHGLFQAICRTNRLGKEDENDPFYKEFGYIIDYKNLFQQLESSIESYTSGAFDAFDADDVKGLLSNRLDKAKERLEDAIEALHQLCLPVAAPKNLAQFSDYFCGDARLPKDLKDREMKRLTFYKLVVALVRAYNNIAGEMNAAGYPQAEADKIKAIVNNYVDLRSSIKQISDEYIDLKKYEPEMRQMLDMYLTATPSRLLSNFGEATLLQLIVENGIHEAIEKLLPSVKANPDTISDAIENNMRKTIIQETPINPVYYEKMSVLLSELVSMRKEGAISYEALLEEYDTLAKQIQPNTKKAYPQNIDNQPKQALYDNLGQNEALAIAMDEQIRNTKDDDWRGTPIKRRKVEIAIKAVLKAFEISEALKPDEIFKLVENQKEY